MGSFFFDPFLLAGQPAAGVSDLDLMLLRQQFGHIFGRVPESPIETPSGGGTTFGPIAGPVDIPPLFGPISGPVTLERERRKRMPFDLGPGLLGLANTALAGLFTGRRTAQGFLPGPQTRTQTGVVFPGTGIPTQTFPERITMPGQVINQGCNCVIQRQLPARTINMKGRAVFDANGQVVGCTPRKRRMNPLNGRAAMRSARRLVMVMRFQKKVQKAIQKACKRPRVGGGFTRRTKKTCK